MNSLLRNLHVALRKNEKNVCILRNSFYICTRIEGVTS